MTAPQDRELDRATVEACVGVLDREAGLCREACAKAVHAQDFLESAEMGTRAMHAARCAATLRMLLPAPAVEKRFDCPLCYHAYDHPCNCECHRNPQPAAAAFKGEKPMSDEEMANQLERAYHESDSLVGRRADWLRVLNAARDLTGIDGLLAERNALAQENAGLRKERDALKRELNQMTQERSVYRHDLHTAEKVLVQIGDLARVADLARGDGRGT